MISFFVLIILIVFVVAAKMQLKINKYNYMICIHMFYNINNAFKTLFI